MTQVLYLPQQLNHMSSPLLAALELRNQVFPHLLILNLGILIILGVHRIIQSHEVAKSLGSLLPGVSSLDLLNQSKDLLVEELKIRKRNSLSWRFSDQL